MTSTPTAPRPRRGLLVGAAAVVVLLVIFGVVRLATRKDGAKAAESAPSASGSASSEAPSPSSSAAAATTSAPPSSTPASAEPSTGNAAGTPSAAVARGCAKIESTLPVLNDWPKTTSRIGRDPGVETRVKDLLGKMTLPEKIGQMTQPEIGSITAAEVKAFHIGSVLNGGGSWPDKDKHATPAAWLALADSFWTASRTSNKATSIPVIWGIDAVHGNNNVYGATLFPHNIGLGAAHDPCLIRDIGAATAQEVRATGQDWTFAPVLAVVQDDRWGRTYESYSENPAITRAYAFEAVSGLQGTQSTIGADHIISTAKHFIGDGGTSGGQDQGVTDATEAQLMNVHGQGYYGAIAAGVQTVMVSYSSWTNDGVTATKGKLHGSKYALTGVLKTKIGFDGVLVSDWNGIEQVDGCSKDSCAQAVNAGLDVIMVPQDWKAFIANTIKQVESGEIPMARIDDAVSRILRVKIRAGVLDEPKPSARAHAASAEALTAAPKALARKAVRESQVLLKNSGGVLPLAPTAKVLVVGKNADSLANQTGGWSLTWQGSENSNDDFPNGTTILAGLRAALGDANVTYSEDAAGVDPSTFDAVIAVIGETPYAEGKGDIGRKSLDAAALYPEDLAVLAAVSGKGAPVVTVLVTGRPLAVNAELNLSDAFVVAWLPGTEGAGVSDLLVKSAAGAAGYTGTLSFSWPKSGCQTPLNFGDADYAPQFPLGYGLASTGAAGSDVPKLDESSTDSC
jgi:beta-glucosidase